MRKLNFLVFIVIAVALIVFDLYKAANASFTHDESFTYLHYVNESVIDILSYRESYANNHILNTLLMKGAEAFFGNSELALRLPNILSHILYLFFTFLLFERYTSKFFIPFFILANANPFLIDFFSLARGYGLAIGLMTSGLYFYCRYIENQKLKHHILSLLFIGLAALANFALLNIFLIMLLVHNIFQFLILREKLTFKNLLHTNRSNMIATILFFIVFFSPIKTIIKDKLIITGGTDGFWTNTVNSLLSSSAYYSPIEQVIITGCQILIAIISLLFLFKCAKYFFKGGPINLTQKITLFFGAITFFIAIGTIIQYWLLGTPFLMGRFALFIYPLFVFAGCFLLLDVSNSAYRHITGAFLFSLSGLFLAHTIYSLNTKWYYEWKSDMDTKNMLLYLDSIESKTGAQNFSMGVNWIFEHSVNYYRKALGLAWLGRVDRDGLKFPNNFFYVTVEDLTKVEKDKVDLISQFPDTKNTLVKYNNGVYIVLRAMNGKYVCADGDISNVVFANRNSALAWEKFALVQIEEKKYAILAYNNLYLSAELTQHNEITATRNHVGEWETFTLIELDSNQIALKAANEKYLTVDDKSTQLYANGDSIGKSTRFEMIRK